MTDVRGMMLARSVFDRPEDRIEIVLPQGITIAEAVDHALPGATPDQRALAHVTLHGEIIPPGMWRAVRPKAWDQVLIEVVPGAGNGNLRLGLLIAVTIAAIAANVFLGPIIGPFAAAIAATAIAIGGSLLVNALVPVPQPDKPLTGQTHAINGFQNSLAPNEPVPLVFGKMRFAPPFAALPYNTVVGDDRYITALFLAGYGPLALSDVWLGRTPIESYEEAQVVIHEGYPDDEPLSLYTQQVLEDTDNPVELTQAVGPQHRRTARDSTEFEIELYFPQGLQYFNHDGRLRPMFVTFEIGRCKVGTNDWTFWTETVVARQGKPLFRSFRYTLPERGQYEIAVERWTGDLDDLDLSTTSSQAKVISRSTWTGLRSYRPESPVNYPFPVALIEVKIKATGQLNGTLNTLSVLASRVARDWDAGTKTWITRETQNPAAAYRYALRGPHCAAPKADKELDLADIEDWHAHCTAKGLRYNRVFAERIRRDDALAEICAAGRAVPLDTGDKWSVIVDRPRTVFTDCISPRNSWGFKGDAPNPVLPDALRIPFKDETADYGDAERIVPRPGLSGPPNVFLQIDMPGKTNPAEVYREGMRRWYEIAYRQASFEVSQDFENWAVWRGDGALLNHYDLDRRHGSARVTAVNGQDVTIDDYIVMETGRGYAVRFRRSGGPMVVHAIVAVPGRTKTLTLHRNGAPMPGVGDLAVFGPADEMSREVIVKAVQRGDDHSATLTLIPHAPEIDRLTDAVVPPAWDGRAGVDLGASSVPPTTPLITSVVSSKAAGDQPGEPRTIVVSIVPGPVSAPVESFEVRHRLVGGGAWTETDMPPGRGAVVLTGYALGQVAEIQARAVPFGAASPSPYTASVLHTVGFTDPVIPAVTTFTAERLANEMWRFTWALAPVPAGRVAANILGIQIRHFPGITASWDDLVPLHTGVVPNSPWDISMPQDDALYTFGVVAVSDEDEEGPRTLILASSPPLATDFLVDDETGDYLLDDDGNVLMDEG
jgi:hypothetical protein